MINIPIYKDAKPNKDMYTRDANELIEKLFDRVLLLEEALREVQTELNYKQYDLSKVLFGLY